MAHCAVDTYNGTTFHRSVTAADETGTFRGCQLWLFTQIVSAVCLMMFRNIREFMVQAGDPTGTGKGGECIWGGLMDDEFHPSLKVRGRATRRRTCREGVMSLTSFFFAGMLVVVDAA